MHIQWKPLRRWAAALALGWGLAIAAHAALPAVISYQGQLTQAGGGPLPGPAQLVFRLYGAATGGAALWTETPPAVALSSGVFSVQLGSAAPLALPFDQPYYLGVSVNGGAELAPRTPLASAPYALAAQTVADGAVTAAKIGQVCAVGETLVRTASGWACGAATGPHGPQRPAGPAGPTGPAGAAGPAGAMGAAGMRTLVAAAAEPAGANCASGGTRVQSGSDADGNGVLDAGEVAATAYVCHGAQGAQGAAGAQGPTGLTGPAGAAGPAGATGAAGMRALIATAAEPVGANCSSGGTRVQSGGDANGNGTLDAGEVAATAYVCHGAQGPQGSPGAQGPAGPAGGGTLVHGCFGVGQAGSSTGYTVAYDSGTGQHTLAFTTPFASAGYTLLLDARAAPTGRARAVYPVAKTAGAVTLALGWLDSAETAQPVCFVAAQ